MNISKRLLKIPIWVVPLFICMLMFLPVDYVTLTSDGAFYGLVGVNYSNHMGLVDSDLSPITSRPLLSTIFGLFYRLFPQTPVTTFFILRLIFVLTPILVFFIGTIFHDERVGLIAALLVVTSFSINSWASVIQIDYILPFFILLYIYTSYQALRKQSLGLHCVAGIAIGLALLTKETSVFYLPLPYMSWLFIKAFRTKKNIIGLLLCSTAIVLLLLPWAIHVYRITNNPIGFLGNSAQEASNLFVQQSSSQKLIGYISSFYNYYQNQLAPNFVLAPLILLSVISILIKIYKIPQEKKSPYIFIILVLLLSTPIIIFQGNVGFRPQQSIIIFISLYVILADMLVQLSDWTATKLSNQNKFPFRKYSSLLGFLIILVPIAIQAGWDKTGNIWQYAENYNTIKAVTHRKIGNWKVEYYDKQIISDWILENIPIGTRFMGYLHNTRPISFLTTGKYLFFTYPFLYSSQMAEIEGALEPEHPILLDLDQFGNQYSQDLLRSNLVVLTEEDLLASITDNEIDYILVGGFYRWLVLYFQNHPDFIKVADFGVGETQIFKVLKEPGIVQSPLVVGEDIPQFLRVIKQTNPGRYANYLDNFFSEQIGIDAYQVEQIIYEESPAQKFDTYINGKTFAELSGLYYGLSEAIAIQESKLKYENYWTSLSLGHLYIEKKEPEKGMEWLGKFILASKSNDAIKNIKIGIQERYVKLYVMRYGSFPALNERTKALAQNLTVPVVNFIDQLAYSKEINFSNTAKVEKSVWIIDGEPRRVLFQHPSSSLTFRTIIPPRAQLEFSPALAPEIWWNEIQDGAEFNVYLRDDNRIHRIFSKLITPSTKESHQHWINVKLNVSDWENKIVEIIFETTPGQEGNSAYDWAGWGEPRITVPIQNEFLNSFHGSLIEPLDSEYVRIDQMDVNYETRTILFAHPDSSVTYDLTLPENPALLFGIGMDTTVWDPLKGDGVEYIIDVTLPDESDRVHRVYSRYIDPKNNLNDRRWFDERVDLSAFAGKQVRLTFQTRPGPAGNYDFDWAGWSRPVLVDGLGTVLPAGSSQP